MALHFSNIHDICSRTAEKVPHFMATVKEEWERSDWQ